MIQSSVEKKIKKRSGEFPIFPQYNDYCLSNVPDTILSLFEIKTKRPTLPKSLFKKVGKFKKVIVLLIDGFGYRDWMRNYKDHDFFRTITRKGTLVPLTSVFPSTTAAALTTAQTGLTPQEHNALEWYVYFKEIGMILATLPFMPMDRKMMKKFRRMKADPKLIFKGKTVYSKMKRAGVKSNIFFESSYSNSSYSKLITNGGKIENYLNSSDMIVKLRKMLKKEKGRAYFFTYFGDVDSMSHMYGPDTDEFRAELSSLSNILKKELLGKIDKKTAKETLLIVTADHGQLGVNPKKTIYLNKYKKVTSNFRKIKGKPIMPTGGPRDVFLHIKKDKVDEVFYYLKKKLAKKAKIIKVEDALKMGLFGINKPSKKFIDRVGDIIILPNKDETVWYEHIKNKKMHHKGHHGGLTEDEMLIPFAFAKLSDICK